MLKDIKNDLMYLLNMVEAIEKIMIYSKEFGSAEEFKKLDTECREWENKNPYLAFPLK